MTEHIAKLEMDGNWVAFRLDVPEFAALFVEEIRSILDSSFADGEFTQDGDEPWLTATIEVRPDGWAAALPEFTGW